MEIYFTYPQVIFVILIPLCILAYLIITNKIGFEEHFTKHALKKLQNNHALFSSKSRNLLLLICAFWLAIALSKPIVIVGLYVLAFEKIALSFALFFLILGFYSLPTKNS